MNPAFWWFAAGTCLALAAAPEARAQSEKSARVLFLAGGSYHDYEQAPKVLIGDLQDKLGSRVKLDFVLSGDLGLLRDAGKYDLLMLNLCQQTELSPEQKSGFLEAVRGGVPVVALHCTFWCFQKWPEFREVLGAFVPGHAKYGPMCLETAADAGSGTAGLPGQFELTDEPYMVNERDPSMHVWVRTCKSYEGRGGAEPVVPAARLLARQERTGFFDQADACHKYRDDNDRESHNVDR
jgi:hypothetical protein